MKLISFRIQNFKSIIDTKWRYLSIDNVTGLIGQNESGKSSILEALYCFDNHSLNPDFLRNDNSFPKISCCFELSEKELSPILIDKPFEKEFIQQVRIKNWRIEITKEWIDYDTYTYYFEDKSLEELFNIPFKGIDSANDTPEPEGNISEFDFISELWTIFPLYHLFEDNTSLLPNSIEIDDIIKNNVKAEGYNGVLNFLKVAGIDVNHLILTSSNSGKLKKYVAEINKSVTTNFQKFWSQKIGKNNKLVIEFDLKNHDDSNPDNAGKPYLEFWIQDGLENLHPKQRSKGVRWFLSFYLQLEADAKTEFEFSKVYLIDEPGSSLHANAQEDVLNVFEELKDKIQILYTTHSPYLIKFSKLYRYLAVQRSSDGDEQSPTVVLSSHELSAASTNTLAPILSCMGIDFSHQNVIQKTNNVILEEISAYYYFSAFKKLLSVNEDLNFIASTGVSNIPQLAYEFIGWGIDFFIIVDDDKSGRGIYNSLKRDLFRDNDDLAKNNIIKLKDCDGVEDLFSISDFYNLVVELQAPPSPKKNSETVKNFSKGLLAAKFKEKVESGNLNKIDLSKESIEKIERIMSLIKTTADTKFKI